MEIYPLVILADIDRLSKSNPLHADFTFITNKHSFFCLSEKVEYAYPSQKEVIEGKRGFNWCYALSEKRDSAAISLILRTIKGNILDKKHVVWNPPQIVIDFDQGNLFFLFFCFNLKKKKKASVIAIQEVLPATEIVFCFLHMVNAIKRKAETVFQEIETDLTAKDFVEAVVLVEFRDFWFSTNSLLNLDFNIKVNSKK